MYAEVPRETIMFQKVGQIGHTDHKQREEDIIACGIPREKYEYRLLYMKGLLHRGEELSEFSERRGKFMQCMTDKGYRSLSVMECNSGKENRWICK
jgi:hypothetical protein